MANVDRTTTKPRAAGIFRWNKCCCIGQALHPLPSLIESRIWTQSQEIVEQNTIVVSRHLNPAVWEYRDPRVKCEHSPLQAITRKDASLHDRPSHN